MGLQGFSPHRPDLMRGLCDAAPGLHASPRAASPRIADDLPGSTRSPASPHSPCGLLRSRGRRPREIRGVTPALRRASTIFKDPRQNLAAWRRQLL